MNKKQKSQKAKDDALMTSRTKSSLSVANCYDDVFQEMRTTSLQEGRPLLTVGPGVPLSKRNCRSHSSLDSLAAHNNMKPGDVTQHQTPTATNHIISGRPTSLEEEMEEHVTRMQTSLERWQHLLQVGITCM